MICDHCAAAEISILPPQRGLKFPGPGVGARGGGYSLIWAI